VRIEERGETPTVRGGCSKMSPLGRPVSGCSFAGLSMSVSVLFAQIRSEAEWIALNKGSRGWELESMGCNWRVEI
jgi:hypothetical protein